MSTGAPGTATWAVADVSRPEQALVARYDLRYGSDDETRRTNGIRMGVAIPFTSAFGPRDAQQMNKVEETIERLVAGRALMVLVLTTPEMREHVFYCGSGDWIASFHQELQRALPTHRVDVTAEQDPEWSVYSTFVK